MTPKTRSILRKLGLAALLVVVIAILAFFFFPGLPKSIKVYDVVQLNKDEWTPAERQWFYHTSQGSHLMPYSWFTALEQWDSEKLVVDPDYLTRFRLIPDVSPVNNPDHLPVGFAKDVAEPTDPPGPLEGKDYVGISCAGCHTALLTYKGMGVRIDGAPGQLDLVGFLTDIGKAFTAMTVDDAKFDRFAARVHRDADADKSELKAQVATFMGTELPTILQQIGADVRGFLESGEKTTTAGFGRLDALGQGGNTLFGKLGAKNLRVLQGPVDVLPLWNAHSYSFVQSNSAIRQPMARNVIEAMAVNASVVMPSTPDGDYPSTVRMGCAWEMEEMAKKLKAPEWPKWLFGNPNQQKVTAGRTLYRQLCAGCHQPKIETARSREWTQWPVVGPSGHPPCDPISWKYRQQAPQPLYALKTFSVDVIGTDPNDAVNFAERIVDARALGLTADEHGANVIYPAIAGIMATYYKNHGTPPETQDEWSDYRSNYWRAPKGYPARPLAGVWATAPFLHNGSVPNLYELLSPVEERSVTFYRGDPEFDPERVGFPTGRFYGGFKLDTSLPGNSNAGHEFRNGKSKGRIGRLLTKNERWELIEFLKMLRFEEEVEQHLPDQPDQSSPCPPAQQPECAACTPPSPGSTGRSPQPQGAAWAQPSPAPTP